MAKKTHSSQVGEAPEECPHCHERFVLSHLPTYNKTKGHPDGTTHYNTAVKIGVLNAGMGLYDHCPEHPTKRKTHRRRSVSTSSSSTSSTNATSTSKPKSKSSSNGGKKRSLTKGISRYSSL